MLKLLKNVLPIFVFPINLFDVWRASKFIVIIAFSNVLNVEYSTVKYSTGDNVTVFRW